MATGALSAYFRWGAALPRRSNKHAPNKKRLLQIGLKQSLGAFQEEIETALSRVFISREITALEAASAAAAAAVYALAFEEGLSKSY